MGLLVIQGKKDVVLDFSKTATDRTSAISIEPFRVDLIAIKPLMGSIHGTWFKMRSANLRAAGLFGDHVDQSPQYREAEKTGDPGSVYINYEFQDELFMIQITSDGAVVVYQNMQSELEIDLLMDVKQSLLDKGLLGKSGHKN